MSMIRIVAAAMLAVTLSGAAVWADARKPSQDEIKALTIKAANLIASKGIAEAEKAFLQEGEFKFGEIYVNVIDFNGNWVVYPPKPENKGKNVLKFVDEDGRKLGEEILATGKAGEGWTEYRWKNPATNSIQSKITFVKRVPGADLIAYVGAYK